MRHFLRLPAGHPVSPVTPIAMLAALTLFAAPVALRAQSARFPIAIGDTIRVWSSAPPLQAFASGVTALGRDTLALRPL
ncbi:MAG: hypothetical protein ABJD07_15185, partial [Gemmatimonadaceae bacterium]